MSKETSRRGLFGALRKAAMGEATPAAAPSPSPPVVKATHPSLRHPEGKAFVGIRDIKPRGVTDVPAMAMPADTALSAEMARLDETPPPWLPGTEG